MQDLRVKLPVVFKNFEKRFEYSLSLSFAFAICFKAKLVETDDITIYYSVESQTSEIARVANDQREEIEDILKKTISTVE